MWINKSVCVGLTLIVLMASPFTAKAADQSLGFALSGIVEQVLVKPGQNVMPGEALVVLDTVRVKARLTAIAAEVKVSKGIADLAARRFDYAQEQFDAVSLSKVELDTARINLDEALARLAKAQVRQTIMKWRLDHSTLKAAQKGRIKQINAWPGMIVNLRSSNPVIVVLSRP
ncbi:MAG: biotin/lipoyl-binding protein [Alphaproteobacteria bacterium]|nr:biotin/lipoyl-binding protein [Alphaproteobacteria bacterium]MBT4085299.1 biotin/lipoyl-binding protein [Alphaproteobacteria bacterium]MBT4544174.1 biotin/lipoyl-binding protein [Alphaproteobacteria bacterium]MBT7744288.1 biotin/lipoyl-binding protein [Alphaproteobacteria bacterium]